MKSLRAVVYVYASILMLASWSASAAVVAFPDDGFMSGPRAIFNGINNLQGSAQAEVAAFDVAGNVQLVATRANVERIQTEGDIFINSQTCALMANELKLKGNLNALGVSKEFYQRTCVAKEGNIFESDPRFVKAMSFGGMPGMSQGGEDATNWMEWLAKGGIHSGDADALAAFMASVHGADGEHSNGGVFDAASGALDGILAEAQKNGGERGFVMEGPEFEAPANAKLAQLANSPNASALGFEGFVSAKAPQVSFYNGINGSQNSAGQQASASGSNPLVRHLMSSGTQAPKAPSVSATHSRTPASDTNVPAPTSNLPDVTAQVNDPKKPEMPTDNSAPKTDTPVQSVGGDSLLDTVDSILNTNGNNFALNQDSAMTSNGRRTLTTAEQNANGVHQVEQSADQLRQGGITQAEDSTSVRASNSNFVSSSGLDNYRAPNGVRAQEGVFKVVDKLVSCGSIPVSEAKVNEIKEFVEPRMTACAAIFAQNSIGSDGNSCKLAKPNLDPSITTDRYLTCAAVEMAARRYACGDKGQSLYGLFINASFRLAAANLVNGDRLIAGNREVFSEVYGRACDQNAPLNCPDDVSESKRSEVLAQLRAFVLIAPPSGQDNVALFTAELISVAKAGCNLEPLMSVAKSSASKHAEKELDLARAGAEKGLRPAVTERQQSQVRKEANTIEKHLGEACENTQYCLRK